MSNLVLMFVGFGAFALFFLAWSLRGEYVRQGLARRIRGRKMTARISSLAQLVDGGNHIPVALTLEPSQIFYESAALQARLDIARIDEVEYDSEQATGKNILRIRAHGQSLEFVIAPSAAAEWATLLPAHRFGDTAATLSSTSLQPQPAPGSVR